MSGWDALLGAIYEAGAFPDRWPVLLDRMANHFGAKGGNFIRSTSAGIHMVSSPEIREVAEEFDRQGWNERNTRVGRLLERGSHPGFLTDSDLHTPEELETLPVYAEFLNPIGAAAGAATLIQGPYDDGIILTIEAFKTHEASREAAVLLDHLRPHIARAAALSSQIQEARVSTLMLGFDTTGSAVALLDQGGKPIDVSARFAEQAEGLFVDGPSRLRLTDLESDRRLARALEELHHNKSGTSIAVRDRDKIGAAVLHLIPARWDARDLFNKVTTFAVLARPGNELLPQADIIAALYDLTPAEARVARAIARGLTPSELALDSRVAVGTVRAQLKRVFAKTSTRRQSELSSLIRTLA